MEFATISRPLPTRRRSTLRREIATAAEGWKTLELENRIAQLELLVKELRQANAGLTKHAAALQAHVDHLDAKVGRR